MQEVPRDDERPSPGGRGISVSSAARRARVGEKTWAMNERRPPSAALTRDRLEALTGRPVSVVVGGSWVAMIPEVQALRLVAGESYLTRAASLLALMCDVGELAVLVSAWAVGPAMSQPVPRGSLADASRHVAMVMMLDKESARSMLGRLAEMRPRWGTVVAELATAVGVKQPINLDV